MTECQSVFKNVMKLFYTGEYEQGKEDITALIVSDPKNPNLYLNRALFLSQMGLDQQAIQDLQISLTLNPRSYIAYFNLFSIQTRYEEFQEAFKSLCCSLSCLYLMKAKQNKSLEDVNRAIQHASNNYEAYVLKGLLQLEKQQIQEALRSFESAFQVNPDNQAIWRLKQIAQSKKNQEQLVQFAQFEPSGQIVDKILKGSILIDDSKDLSEETNTKLKEFNDLYYQVNDKEETVTNKISNELSVMRAQRSLQNRGQSGFSKRDDCVVIEDQGMSTPQDSEAHPEVGNIYVINSRLSQQGYRKQYSRMKNQQCSENFMSIITHQQELKGTEKDNEFVSVMLIEEQKETQKHKNVHEEKQEEILQNEFVSVLEVQEDTKGEQGQHPYYYPSLIEVTSNTDPSQKEWQNINDLPLQEKTEDFPLKETEERKIQKIQLLIQQHVISTQVNGNELEFTSQKQQKQCVAASQQISQQKFDAPKDTEQFENYNLLYPLDENIKLKIRVMALNFVDKTKEQLQKLTDVYCIISYNSKHKLISRPIKCIDNICEWNQMFAAIDLSTQPSDMKVKIYNKKYNSFRDEFLGDMQVLITTADLLRLPIYKKERFVGNLLLNLDVEEVVEQKTEQKCEVQQEDE